MANFPAMHWGVANGKCIYCGCERCGCYMIVPNGSDPNFQGTCTCEYERRQKRTQETMPD